MKTFSVKQGIDKKVFFYIEISYLGISWAKEVSTTGTPFGGIDEVIKFKSVKAARRHILKKYGTSARIKTSF